MSERQRKDEIPTRTTGTNVIDTVKDNTLRVIDEVSKASPQYSQAITNLQTDFLQTYRNFVQTAFDTQRQAVQNFNIPALPYGDILSKQSNEMTSNVIRALGTYNQLAVNMIDASRENTKIFSKTVDSVTDFNANVVKTWTNYWTSQQQQFTRAF